MDAEIVADSSDHVEHEQERPPVPDMFVVEDADSANWVVRKIVEARAYCDRVDAWALREKSRAKRDEEFFLRFFGRQLQDWAAEQVQKAKGRSKSVFLPAATLSFRKQPAKLVVDNEDLVIAWARNSCPEAVTIITKLSKSVIIDHFKNTGEVPPRGIHVEPERETFSIR